MRAIEHAGSNRDHTLSGGENREKSGGQIKWLSTSYSTGAPLVPLCKGPPSLSEALWATRICPVIHYSIQSGGERGGGGGSGGVMEVAEHQADTSRDKMVGYPRKKDTHPRHPSSLTRPETREETNEEEED